MKPLVLSVCLLCVPALGQTSLPAPLQPASTDVPPQPANYANYSLMLINPVPNGGAVVLMHDTKNQLEFVPTNSIRQALDMGFVAVRAAELDELIGALREENARLTAENLRFETNRPAQVSAPAAPPVTPSYQSMVEAQQRAEREARRQRLIQAWMGLQRMNQPVQPYRIPMPVNPNANRLQTNCTTTQFGNTSTTNCN